MVWKKELIKEGKEEGLKIKKIGRMKSNDVEGINIIIMIGINEESEMLEEKKKDLILINGKDKLIEVLKKERRLRWFVVMKNGGVEGLIKNGLRKLSMRSGVDKRMKEKEIIKKIKKGREWIGFKIIGLYEVEGRRENGNVERERIVMNMEDGWLEKEEIWSVDDEIKRKIVGGLREEEKIWNGIENLEEIIEEREEYEEIIEEESEKKVLKIKNMEGGEKKDRNIVEKVKMKMRMIDGLEKRKRLILRVKGRMEIEERVIRIGWIGEKSIEKKELIMRDKMRGSEKNMRSGEIIEIKIDKERERKVIIKEKDIVKLR